MELVNKVKPEIKIKVNSKGNKILVTNSFVVITDGSHYGSDRIRPDILEDNYILPENTIIG